jgi:hypothetical protein
MDNPDGVTHRGQDLRERVKKQKKAAREKKQILKKSRMSKIILPLSIPHAHTHPILVESRQ